MTPNMRRNTITALRDRHNTEVLFLAEPGADPPLGESGWNSAHGSPLPLIYMASETPLPIYICLRTGSELGHWQKMDI